MIKKHLTQEIPVTAIVTLATDYADKRGSVRHHFHGCLQQSICRPVHIHKPDFGIALN